MMKRLFIVAIAALALGWAVNESKAQALTKICFPAETGTGKAPSCRDVTTTNPLPTTATLSASALSVTVTNTTGTPVIVSAPNGFGGNITGTLTVQNLAAGSNLNVLDTNSAAILAGVLAPIPAGTNLIGKVGIDQTTPGTTNLVQAGASFLQGMTPTIQAAAYAAGNCLGGFNALTLANNNGQTGFLTNFRVTSIAGNTGGINVYFFDSNPSGSTCTDKGTLSLVAADVDKLIATIQNGTLAIATGTTTPTNISVDFSPPRPYIAGGSTASGVRTIFYALQAATALTPASTTDIHVRGSAALN